jgi:hypothetical protein
MLEVVKFKDLALDDEIFVVDTTNGAVTTLHGTVTNLDNTYDQEEVQVNGTWTVELAEDDSTVAILRITVDAE